MEKENKKVQAYSLPPHQIAWLRRRAAVETTETESMSASKLLERIIEDAIANTPSPASNDEKKRTVAEPDAV
jgi:hypothetical protein